MKSRLKRNSAAEDAFVKDLEKNPTLRKVERGSTRMLSEQEYPEPIRRFLARERRTIRLKLTANAKKRLEQMSLATGVPAEELARRWVERGLRQAG